MAPSTTDSSIEDAIANTLTECEECGESYLHNNHTCKTPQTYDTDISDLLSADDDVLVCRNRRGKYHETTDGETPRCQITLKKPGEWSVETRAEADAVYSQCGLCRRILQSLQS